MWDETGQGAVHPTPGAAGRDYVVQRVGAFYPDQHWLQRPGEIVAHYDGWLTDHGWFARGIYSESDPIIPQTGFLGKSPTGARYYTRSGGQWGNDARVAVAVWPIRSGKQALGYHVVASVRALFLRLLQ